MEPWWYQYVREAIECIDDRDYQEARALLNEILEYALEEEEV